MSSKKRLLILSATGLAALLTSTSFSLAADLPPPPPPIEIRQSNFDWSGVYVGGYIGVGSDDTAYIVNGGGDPDLNATGLIGGGMIGYNYQMDDVVFGLEADGSFINTDPVHRELGGNQDRVDQDIKWMSTVRARLGWARNNTLFYGTAGVAFAKSQLHISNNPPAPLIPVDAKASKNHVGFVVGGGIEHGFSQSLLARLEYQYARFNKKTYSFSTGDTVKTGIDNMHMIRAGVAYKF